MVDAMIMDMGYRVKTMRLKVAFIFDLLLFNIFIYGYDFYLIILTFLCCTFYLPFTWHKYASMLCLVSSPVLVSSVPPNGLFWSFFYKTVLHSQ